MAAKRIYQSSIDWAVLYQRVPPTQKDIFNVFKQRSDAIIRKALSYPPEAPKINWEYYKKHTLPSGQQIVDQLAKAYENYTVPYPPDTFSHVLDQQEVEVKAYIAKTKQEIHEFEREVRITWASVMTQLPYMEMTMEDFAEAYPEIALDPEHRPTMWPHEQTHEEQVDLLERGVYYPPPEKH